LGGWPEKGFLSVPVKELKNGLKNKFQHNSVAKVPWENQLKQLNRKKGYEKREPGWRERGRCKTPPERKMGCPGRNQVRPANKREQKTGDCLLQPPRGVKPSRGVPQKGVAYPRSPWESQAMGNEELRGRNHYERGGRRKKKRWLVSDSEHVPNLRLAKRVKA